MHLTNDRMIISIGFGLITKQGNWIVRQKTFTATVAEPGVASRDSFTPDF